MQNKIKNDFISVAELARLLNISRIAVFKRIKKGDIPAEKVGRAYIISSNYVNKMITDKNLKDDVDGK